MRGGSLTRFRPDDTQLGDGIIGDIVKSTLLGGLTGLKSSHRLGDLQNNTVQGLKQGLKRGVKRKAKEKWPNEPKHFQTSLACKAKKKCP